MAVSAVPASPAETAAATAHSPSEMSRSSIPVTLHDTEVTTVLGTSESPIESAQIQDWAEETNDTLALLLSDSWYVELLDPVWGGMIFSCQQSSRHSPRFGTTFDRLRGLANVLVMAVVGAQGHPSSHSGWCPAGGQPRPGHA
jgi:hypothetical protein